MTEQDRTIAQVAAEFDVTPRTLRFYEERGLLSPRRDGTTRWYSARDRVRLSLVMRGRRLGFALDEIRRIVDMYDESPGEAGQLRYLLDQVEVRRADLLARRRDLDQTLADLDEMTERCRTALSRMESVAE